MNIEIQFKRMHQCQNSITKNYSDREMCTYLQRKTKKKIILNLKQNKTEFAAKQSSNVNESRANYAGKKEYISGVSSCHGYPT